MRPFMPIFNEIYIRALEWIDSHFFQQNYTFILHNIILCLALWYIIMVIFDPPKNVHGLNQLTQSLSLSFDSQIILLWNIYYTTTLVDVFLKLLTTLTFPMTWCVFPEVTQHHCFCMNLASFLWTLRFRFQSTYIVFVLHQRGFETSHKQCGTNFQKCWFNERCYI